MIRASILGLATTAIAVLAPLGSAAAADGPTKAQCLAADDAAQPLRKQGKLAAAREQLRVCDAPTCPALVRADCTRMMEDLERAQPTVVFDVKDEQGNDLTDVRITVDGTLLTDKVTGTALQADPGQHVFTFETPGKPTVSRTLVLHEGEKDRRESVSMGSAPQQGPTAVPQTAAQPSSATPAALPESTSSGAWGTRRWIAVGLGAAGVAGLAVGGVFGALALSAKSAQQNDCASATSCADYGKALSDHSSVSTDATVSTIAFIGGGALLAAGAVLFFTGGTSPAPTSGVIVAPAVGLGGAGFMMQARF